MRRAAGHHSSVIEELEVIAPSKLAIDNVSKSFQSASGTVHALDHVSLNVAEAEFVCLVGASGCGKSTLLRVVADLVAPTEGEVRVLGTTPEEARRKTIVFVTHNVREAACLGDRVLLFSPHPGRIQEEFAVKLPRPRDINSVDLAAYATRITKALKSLGQVEATVAK